MRLWENKCDLMGKRMDFNAYGKLNVILWEEFSYGKINVILWEKKCYAECKYHFSAQKNQVKEYTNCQLSVFGSNLINCQRGIGTHPF